MRLIDADELEPDADYDDGEYWAYSLTQIRNAPTIEPERKRGRWERHNTYHRDGVSGYIDPDWRCSECGGRAKTNKWFIYILTDFCPDCGADMRV